MVVSQYDFLTHIILMGPHDNPKHEKTLIGAVLENLNLTESRLTTPTLPVYNAQWGPWAGLAAAAET